MTDVPASYAALLERARETALVGSISSLLSWDQETMMPPRGEAHRAKQMGLLAGLAHERATAPQVGALLDEIEASSWLKSADVVARGNVAEIRRVHDRLRRVPRALVEEVARTVPVAQRAWADARSKNEFASFAPHLDKILRLKREEAAALSTGGDPYDALLDEHEPGMKTAEMERMLDDVAAGLVPVVQAIAAKGNPPLPWDGKTWPVDVQKAFCASLAPALGLDPKGSRLDVSAHPFSSRIGIGDLRITTRYDARDPRGALFGTLHETGHALYEQGLDPAHDLTPAGEARSLGLHESQSRLWENFVGRSRAFWVHYFPVLKSFFPDALDGASFDAFFRAVNRVEASFIRVEADEVTYNLHIILRMRIERRMLSGDLSVADVPAAWNEESQRTLGVVPPDDAHGCLQDVHWSVAAFAYFPTYALGNVFAAQLMEGAAAALGDLDAMFARGDFDPLRTWLRENVHRRGAAVSGARVVEDATGRKPDASAFLRYVKRKLGPLYGLAPA